MRGEHPPFAQVAAIFPGSSPHARGALNAGGVLLGALGIIPACAGSTVQRTRPGRRRGDHPRMRGEHPRLRRGGGARWGSSPHARGARHLEMVKKLQFGIIPACAGSTRCRASAGCAGGDHPRMRGEHHTESANPYPCRGSSPHARGAPVYVRKEAKMKGIIPACAGSTSLAPHRATLWRDHPRMRGEHSSPSSRRHSNSGSSPHARGARSRRF